ncbi:MAG: hypothetical protein WKF82_08925, partial [Nocardioidaceae bacterium]
MIDSSGSGHHGAISSDVVVGVTGFLDQAYEFDGPAPIVRVPSKDDLNPGSKPLTISAYLNVPTSLAVGDYNVIQKGPATTVGGAYKLEIFASNITSPKFGYPACAFNSPGGLKNRVYGPKAVNDGAWHHVQCHLTDTEAYVTVDGETGPKAARVVGSIANTVDVTLQAASRTTPITSPAEPTKCPSVSVRRSTRPQRTRPRRRQRSTAQARPALPGGTQT